MGATPRVGKVGLGGLGEITGGVKMESGGDEKRGGEGEGEGGKEKRQVGYPPGYPPIRDPNMRNWLEQKHKEVTKIGKRDTPGCPYWCPKGRRPGNRKRWR
jgi:hypothetical protein